MLYEVITDRKGGADALRDVRKQMQRNRQAFGSSVEDMPVYGTVAAHFNDDGVSGLYQGLLTCLRDKGLWQRQSTLPAVTSKVSSGQRVIVPPQRQRYLAEIAESVREYRKNVIEQARIARERQQLREARRLLSEAA